MIAGMATPPKAARIGTSAFEGERRSPTTNSCLSSRPTTKKKTASRPSAAQWPTVSSRSRGPSWKPSSVSRTAKYTSANRELAISRASTVALSSSMPPGIDPVTMVSSRECSRYVPRSKRSCSVRPALRAGSGLGVGICVSRGRNLCLSWHDKPYDNQTYRLTDAHYATFGGEHTKRFGVVPGCCTSWSRRSPRQLRAVGRSLRSGRGALCRSAVRRSDLGPAATPRGDGSAAACLPCGHGDDAAVWILALPDQRRAACDGRHPTGRPPAGRRRGLVDRGHRHGGGTERDRPHGRPRA